MDGIHNGGQRAIWLRAFGSLAVVLSMCSCATPGAREFDWGFVASRQRQADGTVRLRVAGPFYESAADPQGGTLWALRPLFSTATDPAKNRTESETLWPVASARKVNNELSRRVLLAWYLNSNVEDPSSRWRLWVLPIYFQGRDANSNAYVAVFPIGGKIRDFLFSDEISFVLFPLWSRSRVNDVETQCWLWPIYGKTEGGNVSRFRVFPFYGRSSIGGRWDKKFILWPFWNWVRYVYPGSHGEGYILFPLWGHMDLNSEQTWYLAPPFIRFTKGQRLNVVHCPWPFFQYASGTIEKLYLWPIWGRKLLVGRSYSFALWPLFHRSTTDLGRDLREEFRFIPFVDSIAVTEDVGPDEDKPPPKDRYFHFWPLWRYERSGERTRFETLNLWPLRHTAPVDRSYAPFWTLYSHRRAEGGTDDEVLWGLYRHKKRGEEYRYSQLFPLISWERDDREADRVLKWDLVKGLIGYERRGTQRTYRLLYFIRWSGGE